MTLLRQGVAGPGPHPIALPALDDAGPSAPVVTWSRRAGVVGGEPLDGWSPRVQLLARISSALAAWTLAIALGFCAYAVAVAAIGAVKTVVEVLG